MVGRGVCSHRGQRPRGGGVIHKMGAGRVLRRVWGKTNLGHRICRDSRFQVGMKVLGMAWAGRQSGCYFKRAAWPFFALEETNGRKSLGHRQFRILWIDVLILGGCQREILNPGAPKWPQARRCHLTSMMCTPKVRVFTV